MSKNDEELVNWKTMFKKYTNIVGENEGVTFLYENDWLPEEWKLIEDLDI